MLKKLLFPVALLFVAFPLFSQTIVSTEPENRKVILEEFTGINCVFCPQGHAIANNIKNNYPDDFFVINIHQGGFSNPGAGQPDFRTPFGNAIVLQSYSGGGFGYPSGTVNRQNFPGREMTAPGTTAMGRGNWTISSVQTIPQSSYVNVSVEAGIDESTRELKVIVEAYYTCDSPEATNKLNVALLQNNTLGPQSGGGQGNNYNHMHRLVHLVTGQWGIDINTTTAGSFVSETLTYTIPADYNNVPAVLENMEIVVFISETTQNIPSGNGTFPILIVNDNDVALKSIQNINDMCGDEVSPVVSIQNLGFNSLTSLDIEYSINGGAIQTYTWNGNLETLESAIVELPVVNFELNETNNIVVTISNDDDNSNNEVALDFNASEVFEINEVELAIQLDDNPEETTWNIKNSADEIIHSGGPYTGQTNELIELILDLTGDDCYSFSILDSSNNGIGHCSANGSYSLKTPDGTVIAQGGDFSSEEKITFSVMNFLSTIGFESSNFVNLYPNPTSGVLNIDTETNLDITIFDITGKQVFNASNVTNGEQLDLSGLNSGLYLVKMNDGINNSTQKLIIK
tara:strand:+ start:2804 stop:4519 length:1716 start_codon:yes stop_codon:yes gene_type:complete